MKKRECLECKKEETDCACSDGFKVIFLHGRAVTQQELDDTPTFDEAKRNAKREIKNIEKLLKELNL